MDLPQSALYQLMKLSDADAKLSLRATCKSLQQTVDSREQLVLRIVDASAPLPQLHALGLLSSVTTLDLSDLHPDPDVMLPACSLPALRKLLVRPHHGRISAAISSAAPHLETVHLLCPRASFVSRYLYPDDICPVLPTTIPNIQALVLDTATFMTLVQAEYKVQLTTPFTSHLQDLKVVRCLRGIPAVSWSSTIRHLTSLTRMTLSSGIIYPSTHLPFLRRDELSPLTRLRSLTVGGYSNPLFPQLASLSSLTHLHLSIPSTFPKYVTTELRPFSSLTSLQHLTLTVPDPTSVTLTPLALECLTRCTALTHFATDALYLTTSGEMAEALEDLSEPVTITALPSVNVLSVGDMGFLRTTVPLSSAFPHLTRLTISEFAEGDDPVQFGATAAPAPAGGGAAPAGGAAAAAGEAAGAAAEAEAGAAPGGPAAEAAGEAAEAGAGPPPEAAAVGGAPQQEQQQGQQQQQQGAMQEGLNNLQVLIEQIQQQEQHLPAAAAAAAAGPPVLVNHLHHAPEYPPFDPTVDTLQGLTALQQLDIDMGNLMLYAQQPALVGLPLLQELRVEMVMDPRFKHTWVAQGGTPPLPHVKKLELYTRDAGTEGWKETYDAAEDVLLWRRQSQLTCLVLTGSTMLGGLMHNQHHQHHHHQQQQGALSSLYCLTRCLPGLQQLVLQECVDLTPLYLDHLVMGLTAARRRWVAAAAAAGKRGARASSSSSSSGGQGASWLDEHEGVELARLKVMVVGCEGLDKEQRDVRVSGPQQQQKHQGTAGGGGQDSRDGMTAGVAAVADEDGDGAESPLDPAADSACPGLPGQGVGEGTMEWSAGGGDVGSALTAPAAVAGAADGVDAACVKGARWQPGVSWWLRDVALYRFVKVTEDLLVELRPGGSRSSWRAEG